MATTALHATRVRVTLGGRTVLDGVDLAVQPGEVVALVGPNGAGKSTLLGVLSGDLVPHSGEVKIDGAPLHSLPPARLARMRAVQMQENRIAFAFTTHEVVEMGRAPWRRSSSVAEDDAVIAAAVTDTELTPLVEQRYPTLSGGEKARTGFARVLAQTTPVLLLDEPTAALDIRHQEATLQRARRAARDGAAVVVVLHDLSLAAAYADRMVLLADGQVRAEGAPREVCRDELLSEVYRYPVTVREVGSDLLVVPWRGDGVQMDEDMVEPITETVQ